MRKLSKKLTVGILSAMPEELGSTLDNLESLEKSKYGTLEIYTGNWKGSNSLPYEIKIITAWSGWGKVNSAYTATRIISEAERKNCKIDIILFTGLAGAIDTSLKQWDIVIADSFIQHDMDARPIFNQFTIPNLNISQIKTNENLRNWAINSLENNLKKSLLKKFGKIYKGLIATGDRFITDKNEINDLSHYFSELKAVEMEGGSVAQVLYLESIPYLAIRVISDQADKEAAESFSDFAKDYEKESWNLIKSLLQNIHNLEFI